MGDTQSAALMLLLFKLSHTHTNTHMQVIFLAGLEPGTVSMRNRRV